MKTILSLCGVVALLFFPAITPTSAQIAKSGCCSWHGGVCGCQNGVQMCCDGEPSPSCTCLRDDSLACGD